MFNDALFIIIKDKIFLRCFYQAAVSIKISNLLIVFCNFDFSCPILEIDSFIKNLHIVFSFFY